MSNIVSIFPIDEARTESRFWACAAFANSWQLLISLLYVIYNSVLTQICVGLEWSHYAMRRSFLRTSCPKGMQRSSYFLSLPYRYSIPLSILMVLLHWLISQSIFLVRSSSYTFDGIRRPGAPSSEVGFSSPGILLSLVIGLLLLLFLAFVASQKATFRLPVVSTSSAAISAACHPAAKDQSAALLPVRWGVIPSKSYPGDVGHCSFNTHAETHDAIVGHLYK